MVFISRSGDYIGQFEFGEHDEATGRCEADEDRPWQIGASRARNKALALRYRIRLGG